MRRNKSLFGRNRIIRRPAFESDITKASSG